MNAIALAITTAENSRGFFTPYILLESLYSVSCMLIYMLDL